MALVVCLCAFVLSVNALTDLSDLREHQLESCKALCAAGENACREKCRQEVDMLMDPANPSSPTARGGDITVPWEYPLVKQCADEWGSDLMGNKTICAVGCLMSSTSMGMAGVGISLPAEPSAVPSNPGSFNTWLKANGGYSNNNLIEGVVPKVDPARISWPEDAMHTTNDLSYETVCNYIKAGRIVIGNVHNGGHFVLLVGYSTDGDTIMVNDSGFNTPSYSYSQDIVGYRIFDMARE